MTLFDGFAAEYDSWDQAGNIYLIDTGHKHARSVTNDAVNVVMQLAEQHGAIGERRVYYRDSMGQWGELRVKDGVFAGFAPVKWKTPEEHQALNTLNGETS